VIRIKGDTIYRADIHTLLGIVVTHTLGTEVRIDLIDLVSLGYGTIRTLRLTYITIDALIGNHQCHKKLSSKNRFRRQKQYWRVC
jgi:hypothetical protein